MEQKTYCGRSCENCLKKVALNCPGCRVGPGKPIFGDCELARCCMEKKHSTCQTCVAHHSCALYINRSNLAELRMKRRSEENRRQKEKAEHARIMARWFTVLFWLFLPSLIGSVMSNEIISVGLPALRTIGTILQCGSSIAYCVVLYIISRHEDQYKKAVLFLLLATIVPVLNVFTGFEDYVTQLLISIAALVFVLLSAYHEFHAHSTFFEEIDVDICYSWKFLWKLYIVMNCLVYGSLILAVISPTLTLISVIIGALGIILAGILKQVLLYRSAKRADFYRVFVEEH